MTRKDYIAIAESINKVYRVADMLDALQAVEAIICGISEYCEYEDDRFKHEQFVKKCMEE